GIILNVGFIIFFLVSYSKGEEKTMHGFIENAWHNNIILEKNEEVYLEYPIYITNYSTYNMDVSLESSEQLLNVRQVENTLIDENERFHRYQLSYNLQIQSYMERQKELSNGVLNVNFNKKEYAVDLGTSIISILDNADKSIEVEGGTLLIDRMETNKYEISYTLKNITEDTLVIKGVELNADDKFKIEKVKETVIPGKTSLDISFILRIDSSIKNARIKPKIIYENTNKKLLEANLTMFIIADPIPEERIQQKYKIF
ncbi:MAG: hypothetical protein ACRC28_13340, partial [Clostridium sp.]|uniref:hypothetical protein n=1 Tax=Clostridium sp. TaxID=1506 RepID=UPI003F3333DF